VSIGSEYVFQIPPSVVFVRVNHAGMSVNDCPSFGHPTISVSTALEEDVSVPATSSTPRDPMVRILAHATIKFPFGSVFSLLGPPDFWSPVSSVCWLVFVSFVSSDARIF